MVSWNKFQWDLLSPRWRAQCNANNLFRLSFSLARTQKLKCILYVHVCIYHLKIVLEDSKTWSDISNKAILPCLNCVRAPESEREVVIIDFGIIPGGEMISSLGTFPITLTYCIILWKPLLIFFLLFQSIALLDTAVI